MPGVPILRRSVIICYYCEGLVGFAVNDIAMVIDTGTYYMYFSEPNPRRYDICPHCTRAFTYEGLAKYFPTDSLFGRIVLFLANAPLI